MMNIALISTGGTIEKTYNPLSGFLDNELSVLDVMLAQIILRGVKLNRVQLMNKDSVLMTAQDHLIIALTAEAMLNNNDGVVIVHGTDTLSISGEACHKKLKELSGPIVFTGAMKPYELRSTDAVQNVTEALLAVQILPPGVYLSMQNQVLSFPGVTKDKQRLCFVKSPISDQSDSPKQTGPS
jgi:L-asparaginase